MVADVVMSLDNVIAIAAAAKGDFVLLAIGLAVSIPLIVAGAALIMTIIDRFPVLIWAGAALLGWIAGEAIATDPVLVQKLTAAFGENFAHHAELAAAGAGAMLAIAAGGLWQRVHDMRARAKAARAGNCQRVANDSCGSPCFPLRTIPKIAPSLAPVFFYFAVFISGNVARPSATSRKACG